MTAELSTSSKIVTNLEYLFFGSDNSLIKVAGSPKSIIKNLKVIWLKALMG